MNDLIKNGRVWFGENGGNVPRLKRYLSEVQQGMTPTTIWKYTEVGSNQESRQELKKLFDDKGFFDGPKPVRLLEKMLKIGNCKNSTVLDFFSGSATTAHAVMKLNAEDGGNRKFIMVQLPEVCEEKSEAAKAGYKNICEIGKERIRRAGKKVKEEAGLTAADLDIGFRVLKLDSSNMEDVYYAPDKTSQDDLLSLISNIKPDRTPEDLLFQVMLEFGITLDSQIEETVISGKKVFKVAGNFLIACFDENVTDDVVKAIAQATPAYAVLRDSSFANDSVAANFEQIFATYSPDTERKVL
jgi:adenine-specific DNA-methyltransferase